MYNIGYQKVDKFFYTAQKINRRLCEICFIGSHKTKCVSLDINLLLPQKYFLATYFLLFKFISQQKKLR